MKYFKAAATVGCSAVMGAALAIGVTADDWNRQRPPLIGGTAQSPRGRLAGRPVSPMPSEMASMLPLIGLSGMIALGAALAAGKTK